MRLGLSSFSLVVLTALVAACAPSTFDGLTGGEKDKKFRDPHSNEPTAEEKVALLKNKEPRPISPFSGAWVNTSRPELSWKLAPGVTETTVELSKTRAFAKDGLVTIKAAGNRGKVDKDLEPGVWFWRLRARSEAIESETFSETWSVLVRGKAKNAAEGSPAAHGGIVDVNGDGVPDLTIAYTTREPTGDPSKPPGTTADLPTLGVLFGTAGTSITFDPFNENTLFFVDVAGDAPAVAAGIDLDGDGFGDVVIADIWTPTTPSTPWMGQTGGIMFPIFGEPLEGNPQEQPPPPDDAEEGEDEPSEAYSDPFIVTQPFTKAPAFAVGDFNGDGYGDVSAMFTDLGTMLQGNPVGLSFTLMPFEAPGANPPASFDISAGDFDGDGISDFAYTPFDLISPLRLTRGDAIKLKPGSNITVGSDIALPTRATAMTSGDFDGDGKDEVAFATTVGGKAAVCVSTVSNAALNAHGCWISDAPVAGFGTTLGTGDTDGDGVDEIFVGSANGITILSHAGIGYADDASVFTATPVTGPYSSHFSVFYPGRPGKAQWAVYGTDNHTLYVVEGKGETGATQHYDFSTMHAAKGFEMIEFLHFGTSMH